MQTPPNDTSQRRREIAAAVGGKVRSKLGDLWWAFLVRGLLAVALGIVALFWPSASVAALVLLAGAFLVANGAAAIFGSLRTEERGAHLVEGAITLAIGLVLLIWPGASARTLFIALGLGALAAGIGQLVSSARGDVDGAARDALRTVGIVLTVVGAVLLFWPGTGIVTIAWVIAAAAFVVGAVLLYLAQRLRRVGQRLEERRAGG